MTDPPHVNDGGAVNAFGRIQESTCWCQPFIVGGLLRVSVYHRDSIARAIDRRAELARRGPAALLRVGSEPETHEAALGPYTLIWQAQQAPA